MRSILIADDEPPLLKLLSMTLGGKYRLFLAGDGQKALKMIYRVVPDLIILDVMMPGIDGYKICEEVKSNESTKSIPLIMLSAKSQENDILKGLSLGADLYISKPFDPLELEKRIEELLDGK